MIRRTIYFLTFCLVSLTASGKDVGLGNIAALRSYMNMEQIFDIGAATLASSIMGCAAPALGFGITSAVCFIKANEKQKKLSLGATVIRDPTGLGKSVARPALSLCLNF